MKRRDLFRTGGIALTGALAGCAGLLGGRDGTDADTSVTSTRTATRTSTVESTATTVGSPTTTAGATFEVSLTAPETSRVGTPLPIQVVVTNAGGRSGSFADTLAVRGPTEWRRRVEIEDLPAGERTTATVEVVPDYAGTYELTLESYDTSLSVEATPLTEAGRAVHIGDDLLLTPGSLDVVGSAFLEGPGRPFVEPPVVSLVGAEPEPQDDYFLAVFTAAVENTGQSPQVFDHQVVTVETADDDPALHTTGRTLQGTEFRDARLPGGRPNLVGTTIQPGETVEGFLMAPLTRSDAEGPVSVAIQSDGGGPPEVTVDPSPGGTSRSPPRFEVRSLEVPDQVEINASHEFTVEVANVGDVAGTFRGALEDPIDAEEGKYTTLGTVHSRIPPGETTTISGSMVLPWHRKPRDDNRVRFRPGGVTDVIRTEPAKRAYGETFTLVNGVTVKVMAPTYSDTINYGAANESHGFWTVAVTAELPETAIGQERGSDLLPSAEEFRCYRSNKEFEYIDPFRVEFSSVEEIARRNDNTVESPVQGKLYPISPPDEPEDGRIGGWLSFRIGEDDQRLPLDRIEIQLIKWIYGRTDRSMGVWSRKFN